MQTWHGAFDRLQARFARRLAQEFGTPYILFDQAVLDARLRLLQEAAAGARLFLPYKTCPLAHLRQHFASAGIGAEVASDVELAAAWAHGIAPESLLLNQPARDAATFREAVARGATIVVDGVGDLRAVADAASPARPARVLLRVRPEQAAGASWSRFGMALGGGVLAEGLAFAAACRSLDVVGLHCHLGTNIPAATTYRYAAGQLAARWRDLERALGRRLQVLDFGGGFATASACPLRLSPANWQPDGPAAIVAAIRQELAVADLLPRVALWLEPGRILVEDGAVLVTRVVDVRESAPGRQVTCDSGVHQLPTANWLRHPVARIGGSGAGLAGSEGGFPDSDGGFPDSEGGFQDSGGGLANSAEGLAELRASLLCGALCMETDILRADCALPADLVAGDLLKVGAVGGYDLALAIPFIHGNCPILLQGRAGDLVCLRRRASCRDGYPTAGMSCVATCRA